MQRRLLESDGAGEEAPPPRQGCDHPLCTAPGEHRAPKARDRLHEYYWFCLDHVREYNRAWDYYAGWSAVEIETAIREDTVWQRPTWPLGQWRVIRPRADNAMFGDRFAGPRNGDSRRRPETAEERALAMLDLSPPVTPAEIKSRYIGLVKRLHPDANGGDKLAEERLKSINQAYATLKQTIAL